MSKNEEEIYAVSQSDEELAQSVASFRVELWVNWVEEETIWGWVDWKGPEFSAEVHEAMREKVRGLTRETVQPGLHPVVHERILDGAEEPTA